MTNKQVILIIEDEKNIGNYIETIIISNGYKALRAMNGMSGLSLCTSHHPDLILLDLGPARISMAVRSSSACAVSLRFRSL